MRKFIKQHLTVPTLIISDLLCLVLIWFVAYWIRSCFDPYMSPWPYVYLLPSLIIFIPLYASMSLYPDFFLSGPDRLKRFTIATSSGFLALSLILFFGQHGAIYSRLFFALCWLLALFALPLSRVLTEFLFGRKNWWGTPVVLIGQQRHTRHYAKYITRHPGAGFQTVKVLNFRADDNSPETLDNALEECRENLCGLRNEHPGLTAVLVLREMERRTEERFIEMVSRNVRRIVCIYDERLSIRLSMRLSVFCGALALKMSQNLLDPYRLQMKRIIELATILLFLPLLVPLMLILYLAVRLDSRGPGFYKQERVGRDGKPFMVLKFRTMRKNADALLVKYLQEQPALRAEWELDHKLKNDPRITRVGKFLRRTSLDELPQIINVIRGEMSLVGPRPIVAEEIEKYADSYENYKMVLPGITGVWQVSGRNNLSYSQRVTLDNYYIANWSVWLDIYTLLRTVPAVVFKIGAY